MYAEKNIVTRRILNFGFVCAYRNRILQVSTDPITVYMWKQEATNIEFRSNNNGILYILQ